jgi:hypothetical protein
MKAFLATTACCTAALLVPAVAVAQNDPWWNGAPDAPAQKAPAPPPPAETQPQPPPAPQAEPTQPTPPPPPTGETQPPPPPGSQAAPQYPPAPQVTEQMAAQGEWVYTTQYGWTWVPNGSTAMSVGVQPYVYLFAPAYGWRWFVSPWGVGPFYYGAWGWGPRWGPRYAPPRGLGGFHYAPGPGARGVYAPRAYGGAVHGATPMHVGGGGGAARGFAGSHAGAAHFGGGGGHHR